MEFLTLEENMTGFMMGRWDISRSGWLDSLRVCVCVQCLWLVCGDLCAVEKWLPC